MRIISGCPLTRPPSPTYPTKLTSNKNAYEKNLTALCTLRGCWHLPLQQIFPPSKLHKPRTPPRLLGITPGQEPPKRAVPVKVYGHYSFFSVFPLKSISLPGYGLVGGVRLPSFRSPQTYTTLSSGDTLSSSVNDDHGSPLLKGC